MAPSSQRLEPPGKAGRFNTDLWILGATVGVSDQIAKALAKFSTDSGVATLILDWPKDAVGRLAICLAAATEPVVQFLNRGASDANMAASSALTAIATHPQYEAGAKFLLKQLEEALLGSGGGTKVCESRLLQAFASRDAARRQFGQPLCPGAPEHPAIKRVESEQVAKWISEAPDGSIGAVIGPEGTGKSWLLVDTWRSSTNRPLTLLLTAEQASIPHSSPEDLLIEHLSRLAPAGSDRARRSWQRRFARWKESPTPGQLRILVVFDGLNQRPDVDWSRLVNETSELLDQVGGRLVLTSRSQYFKDHLQQRLISRVEVQQVSDWTEEQRDLVLQAHGLAAPTDDGGASNSLCNPRLLGIAVRLIKNGIVSSLDDLNESRLLFEHMRHQEQSFSGSLSAARFATRLCSHAREVLDRLKKSHLDDLVVFSGELEAAAEGRFFESVPRDSSRYQLKPAGLTMALAFALLDDLRGAERTGRNIRERLSSFVDPISALDRTTEVLLAALTIACMDEDYSEDTTAAVIAQFSSAQNPAPQAELPAFIALAKKAPRSFLKSAHHLLLEGNTFEQFDWLDQALLSAAVDERSIAAVREEIRGWLLHFSPAIDGETIGRVSAQGSKEAEAQRQRRSAKSRERLEGLTDGEQALRAELVDCESESIHLLVIYAFRLMHGRPIAPMADALAHWSFAETLNGSMSTPDREFASLIRGNRKDWKETRNQLVSWGNHLAKGSRAGKWAAVALLRATGNSDDSRVAEALAAELTADRNWPQFAPHIERYCTTDPCDPGSSRPENVTATAAKYAEIDASQLRLFMGVSEVDHFFSDARPAMARFEPDVGAKKHRELIASLFQRSGLPLRQALFEVREHAALVTGDDAEALVARAGGNLSVLAGDRGADDRLLIGSLHLQLAAPQMSALEQLFALQAVQENRNVLLSVLELCSPLTPHEFQVQWGRWRSDPLRGYLLLAHALWTETQLPPDVLPDLVELASSEDPPIRELAMSLVASSEDNPSMCKLALNLGSYVTRVDRRERERWAATRILCTAAQCGVLNPVEAVSRAAPELYGSLAVALGGTAAQQIATRLDLALSRLLDIPFDLPDIEITLYGPVEMSPKAQPFFAVEEAPSAESQSPAALRRFLEENNELRAQRRKRVADEFRLFKESLEKNGCALLLDHLGFQAMEMFTSEQPELALNWASQILGASAEMQRRVAAFGAVLAAAISHREPDLAVDLLGVTQDGFIRTVYGPERLDLHTLVVWRMGDHPRLDALRTARLDQADNDNEIATEVLAALRFGKQALLDHFIQDRLASEHPLDQARAAMVAGYSFAGPVAEKTLAALEGSSGFLHGAWKAARDAYVRDAWARHWYAAFLAAEGASEIWRNGVLLLKVVDPRFELWREQSTESATKLDRAGLEDRVRVRYQRLQDKRKRSLYGAELVQQKFLQGLPSNVSDPSGRNNS